MKSIIQKTVDIIKEDKFRFVLIIVVILLISPLFFTTNAPQAMGSGTEVHFFYSPSCKYCAKQKIFNQKLKEKYNIKIIGHDITRADGRKLYILTARKYGIPLKRLGVPLTVVGDRYIIGFHSESVTGPKIEAAIKKKINR